MKQSTRSVISAIALSDETTTPDERRVIDDLVNGRVSPAPNLPKAQQVLTYREAMTRLRVRSKTTIIKWCRQGKLRQVKFAANHAGVTEESVERLIASGGNVENP